jgi:hypothetical protein
MAVSSVTLTTLLQGSAHSSALVGYDGAPGSSPAGPLGQDASLWYALLYLCTIPTIPLHIYAIIFCRN